MGLKDELVSLNDPQDDDQPEEEEEEEELVDPLETARDECRESAECARYREILDACTQRVEEGSTEKCVPEFYDFIHCVDKCAGPKAFAQLK